jgi:hypothetical protein
MSFTPGPFGDLGKACGDLFKFKGGALSKKNPADKKEKERFSNEFVVKHNTPDGFKLETTCGLLASPTGSVKVTKKEKSFGKYVITAKSKGDLTGKFTFDQLEDNLQLDVEGTATEAGPKGAVTAKYTQESFNFGAKASYTAPKGDKPNKIAAVADLVFGVEGISVGGQVKYDFVKKEVAEANIGIQYEAEDFQATLSTAKFCKDATLSGFYKVNADTQVGLEFNYEVTGEVDTTKSFAIATQHQLDADTEFRARADTDNFVALRVTHKLSNPSVKIGVSTGFNAVTGDDKWPTLKADTFGIVVTLGDL